MRPVKGIGKNTVGSNEDKITQTVKENFNEILKENNIEYKSKDDNIFSFMYKTLKGKLTT